MVASLLLLLSLAPAEVDFRLDNGLRVILVPQPGHPVSVVALGVRTGVHDEPEGRCGLAHLTEHVFLYGTSKTYPAYRAFEALTRDGPLGIPFQDVNAETLWNLTYFYAVRPSRSVDLALEVFAEKLARVTFSRELLETERKKVLAEIQHAEALFRRAPALRKSLEAEYRYPKAGIASHVRGLEASHVEGYLRQHYRPDRAILLVQGAIDVGRVRKRVETLFGPCRAHRAGPMPEGTPGYVPAQVIASYSCAGVGRRQWAALRLAGAAWEAELRKLGRAYVEAAPGGVLRVVLFGSDPGPLRKVRDILGRPLPEEAFREARARAGAMARSCKQLIAFQGDPQKAPDAKACARAMAQLAINRLRFEAEGGKAYLERLDALSPEEVAAAVKKFLTARAERLRRFRPSDPHGPGRRD